MYEQVEIFLIDEEGILLRAHTEEAFFFYEGDPEEPESPLMVALRAYYLRKAPRTIMSRGFDTPRGMLYWQSELASPFGDDGHREIGERLYLTDEQGERFMDELAYDTLAQGKTPLGWEIVQR